MGGRARVIATLLTTAFLSVAACSHGDHEEPAPARSLGALGAAQRSGVEDLPVPEVATLATTTDTCDHVGDRQCINEVWSLPPDVAMEDLRSWYDHHAPNREPRGSWEPCFGGDPQDAEDERGMANRLFRTWHRDDRDLLGYSVEVSTAGTHIEVHLWSLAGDPELDGSRCQ